MSVIKLTSDFQQSSFLCLCINFFSLRTFSDPLSLLSPSTTFQSSVRVSDSGMPMREASCVLSIRLYQLSSTVYLTIRGDINTNVTLEELLEDFLTIDIVPTKIVPLNSTHFQVQAYGKNLTAVIAVDELVSKIGNLTEDQKRLLLQAGITITGVVSNRPVRPPSRVPAPSIPAWAVVVIVILNSVIIIAVLVIILVMLLRSLRK